MIEDRVPENLELKPSFSEKSEPDEELALTPSPEKEHLESGDLILEAETIPRAEEITFDGKTESESRIEEAMKAYDAAMDEAAGIA